MKKYNGHRLLAIVISLAMIAALVPAAAMAENEPVCGKTEHIHTIECYELTCTTEEGEGHTHDASCYDDNDVLICGLEETEGHEHGDECYTLVCEQEEHTHTADCYAPEVPVTDPAEIKVITGFRDVPDTIRLPMDAETESPFTDGESLFAAIEGEAEGAYVELSWTSEPEFNGNAAGTYIFTPIPLDDGYTIADGLTITVEVLDPNTVGDETPRGGGR